MVRATETEVQNIKKAIDAYLPRFFNVPFNTPKHIINRLSNARWAEITDIPEFIHDCEGYSLSLEVPGTEKKDIEVRVDPVGRTLGVVIKEFNIDIDENRDVVKQQYAVSIPGGADISVDPKATLELGILSITFPEDVATKPRIIEVTVE